MQPGCLQAFLAHLSCLLQSLFRCVKTRKWLLTLKTTGKHEEDKEEVIVSLAIAKEISVGAAVAAVLLELEDTISY